VNYLEVLLWCAAAVIALFVVAWAVSVPLRNASIVDVVWGLSFCVIAWTARVVADGYAPRQNLLVGLVTLWGMRLAAYLFWRNTGKGEDFRYAAMRRRAGPSFTRRSLVTVFLLQAAMAWTVSLPIQVGQAAGSPRSLGWLSALGVAVWLVGVAMESIGDGQLARFKADPQNAGKVMDRGLWRYTRHPNYFGDFCVWWGIFLVAAEARPAWITVVGPLVMSTLLLRVSGVALLERTIGKRRPEYARYIERTSAFFPRRPRR
jgi:steroid 5-alpha reductase family enzyme